MTSNSDTPFPSDAPNGVDRTQPEPTLLSRRSYLLMIGFWTALGFVLSAIMTEMSEDWDPSQWNGVLRALFFVGSIAAAIISGKLSTKSSSRAVSLISYALLCGFIGLIAGPIVGTYDTASIIRAYLLMALLAVVLGFIGVILPRDLSVANNWFLGGLILAVGIMLIGPIMGSFGLPSENFTAIVDWATLLIFSGLVVFHVNRVAHLPHTHNNASGVRVILFLCLFNIFLRAMSVMG